MSSVDRAILFLAGIACGCSGTQNVDSGRDVEARVDRMMPTNASLEASAIAVRVLVMNPLSKPMAIVRIDHTVDTGDVAGVITGSSDVGDTIDAGQTVELEFKESVPLPESADAYRAILERGTLPIAVRGKVVFGDGTTAAFEKKGEVATPRLPRFIVHDAQAARHGKEGVEVTFFLRLLNENPFTVNVEGVEYGVYVEEKLLKSEQSHGIRLVSGAVQEFEVSAPLDRVSKEDAKELLAARVLGYHVLGTVHHSRLDTPFDHRGEIRLNAEK